MTNLPQIDVLVIGGGPAGASAAIRLRQSGLSVVVAEKLAFPRFRIGESLLPNGNALLRELGVWETIERSGFVPKFGARFYHGEAEKTVVFARGLIPGLGQTYQVDRAKFDAILLNRARELGADVHTETAVRSLRETPDACEATLAGADGESVVRARYVVDCSGRDQFFANEIKSELEPAAFPRRIAIYSHFRGVPRPAGPEGGDTVIVRLPDGWFWIIPIDSERTSVGLVTTNAAFKAAGLAPAAHFDAVVARTPRLRELLGEATATMGHHVTTDYSYYRRRVARGRYILAGDAAGFLDPIFSSGVYLALRSSSRAAKLVSEAACANRPLRDAECEAYRRDGKRHAGVFHRLIDAFYDDYSFPVFMTARPPWGLAPTLTSIVAGCADLTPAMWVRFRIFLLVCRIHRVFRLAPGGSAANA